MEDMTFQWSVDKNDWLKTTRGVGFEDVVQALREDRALADIENPRRSNQRIIVFLFDGYVHAAPYVLNDGIYFLKTIYPERDLNAQYARLQ